MATNRLLASPFEVLDRIFDQAVGPALGRAFVRPSPFPPINVWEDGDHLMAEAEVPGMKLEDLEILVEGEELTIKGKFAANENKESGYLRRERVVGEFSRTISLPRPINSDRVEATLKDGVLTIKLPKAEEAKARKIAVRSA